MTIFLSITEGKSFLAPAWSSLSRRISFQKGALLSVELDEIMPLGTGEDEPQAYFSFYIYFFTWTPDVMPQDECFSESIREILVI